MSLPQWPQDKEVKEQNYSPLTGIDTKLIHETGLTQVTEIKLIKIRTSNIHV